MAGNIGRSDIARVLASVNVVDLIHGDGVALKKSGKDFVGLCPFHDDSTPSLQVSEIHQNWICRACMGGDKPQDAFAWLMRRRGWKFPEAYRFLAGEGNSEPAGKIRTPAGPIVATYDYTDAEGTFQYQVTRHEPGENGKKKTFRQRRANHRGNVGGSDEWIWNLDGVQRVLYKLPAVLGSKVLDAPVYITEGEKDADTLEGMGLIATTAAQGAGNWKDAEYRYSDSLIGRDVVIWGDNDDPGKAHVKDIHRSLLGKARSIRILESKFGKDATDHLCGGGTLEDAVDVTPATKFKRMSEVEEEEIEWILWPFLFRRGMALLAGNPGEGKTYLALAMCALISRGMSMADVIHDWQFKNTPRHPAGAVLFLTQEDAAATILRPRLQKMGADMRNVFFYDDHMLFDEAGMLEIETLVAQEKIVLIVADPWMAYLGGRVNLAAQNETRAANAPLKALCDKYNCGFLGLAHLNKKSEGSALMRVQGSVDFPALCRSAMLLGSDPDDSDLRVLCQFKINIIPRESANVAFTIDDGEFRWAGRSKRTSEDILNPNAEGTNRKTTAAAQWLESQLRQKEPQTKDELFRLGESFGLKSGALYDARKYLDIESRSLPTGRKGRNPSVWARKGFDWATWMHAMTTQAEVRLELGEDPEYDF